MQRNGMLFAAGLITGEALMGIVIAIPIVSSGRADVLALPSNLQFGEWLGLAIVALAAGSMPPDRGPARALPLRPVIRADVPRRNSRPEACPTPDALEPGHEIIAAFAVIYLVWGSTFLANKIGVGEMPPLLFTAARFLIAGTAAHDRRDHPRRALSTYAPRMAARGPVFDPHGAIEQRAQHQRAAPRAVERGRVARRELGPLARRASARSGRAVTSCPPGRSRACCSVLRASHCSCGRRAQARPASSAGAPWCSAAA